MRALSRSMQRRVSGMPAWPESFEQILLFMERGGYVLWGIFALSLVLWSLIIERYVYLLLTYPKTLKQTMESWRSRSDTSSWAAHRIREAWLSEVSLQLTRSLSLIKTLVAVCPLLGLLGTVTGMIHIFDVIAVEGSSNARAMATNWRCPPLILPAVMFALSLRIGKSSKIESICFFNSFFFREYPPISRFSRTVRDAKILSS